MISVLDHPLVRHDITIMRNKKTPYEQFRAAARRIGVHLAIAASQKLPLSSVPVETPLEETEGFIISRKIILLPILRAGMTLVDPFMDAIPFATIGYIGLRRNEETLQPEEYMFNMPRIDDTTTVIILDPMLATGGSICATLGRLQLEGAQHIIAATMISAPEGIERVLTEYPGVHIVTAALDRQLNEKGFILPGLGDAGDRLHGT